MGTATKKQYNDSLAIWNEMSAFDKKDYNYYDRLTDDQKQKFSPYLLMRWGSTVEASVDIESFYTIAVNEYVNYNFWDLQKHKKLQWLSCCASSPNIGKQRHYWLGSNKKKSSSLKKLLKEKLINIKEDEIDILISINSTEVIKEWLLQNGTESKILKTL
jgi:hypothetical protein